MTDTPAAPTATEPRPSRKVSVALVVAIAALGVSGWQWFDSRQQLGAMQVELASKLAESGGATQATKSAQEQGRQALEQLSARLALTEARVTESAGQYATLQGMYAELTRNREDWQLAEIEHALTIASQQLDLAGNVPATISALEAVDAKLAGLDKAQFVPLRRAVGQDLEKLKALPFVDTIGLTVKIDGLLAAVDTLPLVVDGHRVEPAPQTAAAPAAPAGHRWQTLGAELWHEFSQLIRIRRMDKPDALLLSPDQAFFLRENLKLRLLNARLALLQRDDKGFHAALEQARGYASQYFDNQAGPTQRWQAALKDVAGATVALDLPNLSQSLKAAQQLAAGHGATGAKP